MRSLTHALLTEDETVILEALEPSPGDRVLAVFARGNGDAGLCLLQAGPAAVFLFDAFDRELLVAQFELKRWLYSQLDYPSLRGFLGIAEGWDSARRSEIIDRALNELRPASQAFWQHRRASLRKGMARHDSTAAWARGLERFIAVYRRLPTPLRSAAMRVARLLAPLYFPPEERRHSLGYRQWMARPEEQLSQFLPRLEARGATRLIPYADFRYLSPRGHEVIRACLNRVRVLDGLPPPLPCNKIYLSNVIDYLSADDFHRLLREVLPPERTRWTALVNSTYVGQDAHPHLQAGIRAGWYHVDWNRTNTLRFRDRVGIYPGLTVISVSACEAEATTRE